MNENKKRSIFRTKKLLAVCICILTLLIASTYAWFIGMRTVSINKFTINIASTDSLLLSMDGRKWSFIIDPTDAPQYPGNANQLLDEVDTQGRPLHKGLIPMSTIGEIDPYSSRMKIFDKGSMTATDGGYRLLTGRIRNYTDQVVGSNEYIEGDGYVAFDLFIKNVSKADYYPNNDLRNEEDLYLTFDSQVNLGEGSSQNTGIENAVRVAFMQIGRVKGTTNDPNKITGITCEDTTNGGVNHDGVTGTCRNAYIWEPNERFHVDNAMRWYQTSCRKRNNTLGFSYSSELCNQINNGDYVPTYAASRELIVGDDVDIYDGERLNANTRNTTDYDTYINSSDKGDYKLVKTKTFTDSDKMLRGADRIPIMSIAPNSITKVRVYIYLEGQDIDNYDFASLGQQIEISFGFTKERFLGEDIEYDGPEIIEGEACPKGQYRYLNKCVKECPEGFYISEVNNVCVKNCLLSYKNRCVKECPEGLVNKKGVCTAKENKTNS